MSAEAGKFGDLSTRVASGAAIAGLAVFALWSGDMVLLVSLSLVVGLLYWELTRMLAPEASRQPLYFGIIGGVMTFLALLLGGFTGIALLIVPAILGSGYLVSGRKVFFLFALIFGFAALSIFRLRVDFGLGWVLWLVLVAIVTDIAGYFAGRALGGPKLWPRVSPKKTWSGTVAGWIAAAAVGAAMMGLLETGASLIWLSVALSMAAQAGDIGESAVKRRAGVKDSSDLIPGHGGLFDRFDGMLAVAVVHFLLQITGIAPPGLGG